MIALLFDSFWYWFSAALLLFLLELMVPGAFLVWIGLGAAMVGVFLAVFPQAPLELALLVLAASVIVSVLLGVYVQKQRASNQTSLIEQGLAMYLGREFVLEVPIKPQQTVQIRLDDTFFSATSTVHLVSGQLVRVKAVQGNTLYLEASAA